MDKKVIQLSFDEVLMHVSVIVDAIHESGDKYDLIIGLSRGGVIPAGILSYKMHHIPVLCINPLQGYSACMLYELTHRNILIVDNISRSGETLLKCVQDLKELTPDYAHIGKIATCALHRGVKVPLEIAPNFYSEVVSDDEWIVYPWDASPT